MDVDPVVPRCQAVDLHIDVKRAGRVLGEGGEADDVAGCVAESRRRMLGPFRARSRRRGDDNACEHSCPGNEDPTMVITVHNPSDVPGHRTW